MLPVLELELNAEQKKAVEYNDGPLLIVAGAGTGKTFALVEKVKYLISQNLAKPEEIVCLTFTEKAAREMEARVDQALPYGYSQMYISTFHSFADQVLREGISHIGLNADYKLMTQAEAVIFFRKRLFLFNLKYFRPLGNPHKFIESMLQHFSRLRDEAISPEEYERWAQNQKDNPDITEEEKEKWLELAHAYVTYDKLKIEEGVFDFGDLIYYLLQLYKKRPNILLEHRKQFKYVMIDEFQDTNIAQYALIKQLCPPETHPHLTVVGDDSQAIYKFRGASISNILTFMKDYDQAEQVTLNDNYRSNQGVLDSSYRLIQYNNPDTLESQLGISKKLQSHKKTIKDAVVFHYTDRVENEADKVVSTILQLKKEQNYDYCDFAILVRANGHADPFINALGRQGVPYQFLGPGMLFKQTEVKDLIAYLKLLNSIEDTTSTYRVLSMNIFGLDQQDINLLIGFAKKTALSLFQATEVYLSFFNDEWYRTEHQVYKPYIPLLKEESRNKLIEIVKMVKKHLQYLKVDTAGEILYSFLEQTGYLKKISEPETERDVKIATNISKFFDKLKSFETTHEDASVFAVVEFIDMSMELGESPSAGDNDVVLGDTVRILTVHASKGLEFPVVFLVNLSNGRFPTYEKREAIPIPQELIKELLPSGDYHTQEERRLFYVGLTRAMDRAYLSASQFYGEGKRERKISRFVQEALGEEAVRGAMLLKKEEKTQLSIFDFKKVEIIIPPTEPLQLKNFSYTQLESFNVCPLQYKYQYVLKLPTQSGAAASFGDSIHKTLQRFYELFIQDRTTGLDTLLSLYEQLWVPIGYSSDAYQKTMKREGKQILENYFKTFHHPDLSILALEKLFKIKVDTNIHITGKIDRIDNKSNGEVEIIDYKTGKKPSEKDLEKNMQLSIYAMAAMDKGLYNKKLEQVTLTFYYLQTMEKISMHRTQEDILTVRTKISETVERINENKFAPKVGPWCDFCPFRIICEAW